MNHKFLASACVAMMLPSVVMAQYPQITKEAQAKIDSLEAVWTAHSDSAWAVAFPIVKQEAMEGRPYVPWASRPYDLRQASIPAFPGAEGGGMYTFGGRGGKVLTVSNLNDDGPGSFRWACEQGGARIIVFNVSGIIQLKTPIIVRAPYITIAGQTAPGDGVCIAGESFQVDTHDVIVRHMRFRRGNTHVWYREDSFGGNPVGNIMIDHCSCEWGLDENISFYRHMFSLGDKFGKRKEPTVNVTIQNTISAKALDTYNHAFGSTIGGENASFMRNLWADNTGRNPSIVIELPLAEVTVRSHRTSTSPSCHPVQPSPPPNSVHPSISIHSLEEGRCSMIRSPAFKRLVFTESVCSPRAIVSDATAKVSST